MTWLEAFTEGCRRLGSSDPTLEGAQALELHNRLTATLKAEGIGETAVLLALATFKAHTAKAFNRLPLATLAMVADEARVIANGGVREDLPRDTDLRNGPDLRPREEGGRKT